MTKKIICGSIGLALGFLSLNFSPAAMAGDLSTGVAPAGGGVEALELYQVEGGIKWELSGNSPKGFKVLWSKNPGPNYPLRDGDKYHYYSDPSRRSDALEAFSGPGTYYARVCEYLGGSCGRYSNEIAVELADKKEAVACTMEYDPVCGVDGKTYGNKCMLSAAGVAKKHYGECAPTAPKEEEVNKEKEKSRDDDIDKIREKAGQLSGDQMGQILAELKELRDLVKEQQTQITHLRKLLSGVAAVTERMQSSINNFITYGVDENTKKLGEGERAAVMYSYRSAFERLPENEADLADAIKIANGRWPAKNSEKAESAAKSNFRGVYLREPDMDDHRDNAAVTIMAYGLRQKAENRSLESEKRGIMIFKDLFHRLPSSTEDWNIMQAITYSGATR